MSIVTLSEAKAQLGISGDDVDDELQEYVDGITGVVEQYLGRVVEQRSIVDDLVVCNGIVFPLRYVPVITLDAITSVDGLTVWNPNDMHVDKDAGIVSVTTGPPVNGHVEVTYTAGYADGQVPTRYKRGALVILQHTWETQRGVGSVRSGVIGQEETYDPRLSYSIPRKALEWLGSPLPGIA